MTSLSEYLKSISLTPEEIAKGTKLPLEIIERIICGDINIMDVDIGTILLLCHYLQLPISSFIGYCSWQGNVWQISAEKAMYYSLFRLGNRIFKSELGPVNPTNTKYIKHIALVDFECCLLDIIQAKKGRLIEYKKRVELEMQKVGAPDWCISTIDDDELETYWESGHTPKEAAEEFLRSWRS